MGDSDFATEREHRLEAAVRDGLPKTIPQGRAGVPRTVSAILDSSQPNETDGVVLWIRSAWGLILFAALFAFLRFYVIAREERYLERRFGGAYAHYRSRVRRWA